MATYENKSFTNQAVVVDGNRYVRCAFNNSTLVYKGGELPLFENCVFRGGSIQLEESAYQTVKYLNTLYRGGATAPVETVLTEVAAGNPTLAPRYEPIPAEYTGTNWGQLGRIAGVLGLITVLLSAAIWYGFLYYPSTIALDPARAEPLIEQVPLSIMPALPETLGEAYDTSRAQQTDRLSSYGWVDRSQGIARVPIEVAFSMMAEGETPEMAMGGE